MGYIKSNKTLIIGILIGILVVGGIFFVSTQTSLFNEDAKLFNEAADNVDDTGEVITGESDGSNATGIIKAPKEIEGFIDLPSTDTAVNNINEDGTYEGLEAEVTALWSANDLISGESESGAERDLKGEARVTAYEDYIMLKEDLGVKPVEEMSKVYLGQVGFHSKLPYIYKTNEVVELGDISIVGANLDSGLVGVDFDVQNTSGKVLDMEEVEANLQYRFTEDYGMGTDWETGEAFSKTYNTVEEYVNGQDEDLDRYLGRNLVKTVKKVSVMSTPLEDLDTQNILTEELTMLQFGEVANKDSLGDKYGEVKTYQDNLPDELNMEVKYGDKVSEYTILKSTEDIMYNYEEMVK